MPEPEDFGDPCSLLFNMAAFKLALEAWEPVCMRYIDNMQEDDDY